MADEELADMPMEDSEEHFIELVTDGSAEDWDLAVYRHDPGDDEGNRRRAAESMGRLMARVLARHEKKEGT